jgi:hypothetical protein
MAGRVAVLGTPGGYAAAHTAFQQSWRALAAVTVLAAIAAIGMTPAVRRPPHRPAPAPVLSRPWVTLPAAG